MKFEVTSRTFSIKIDEESFGNLLDSESYVTDCAAYAKDQKTLDEKLDQLPGITDVEYDGHFGNAIYFSIPVSDDTPTLRKEIVKVIKEHLQWCTTLPK